jgi:hypothetical protein
MLLKTKYTLCINIELVNPDQWRKTFDERRKIFWFCGELQNFNGVLKNLFKN